MISPTHHHETAPEPTPRFALAAAAGMLWLAAHLAGGTGILYALGPALAWILFAIRVRPAWLRRADRICHRAIRPVWRLISEFALAVLYFGLLTPVGLVLRACGRDHLQMRQFDEQTTAGAWLRRTHSHDPEQFFRMF